LPSILGHEFTGAIVDTGGHAGWKTGDHAAVCPALPCGTCRECRAGFENICANLTAFGYERDGGFAELIRVPKAFIEAGNLFRLDRGVSQLAAALAEPLSCVINGQDIAGVTGGDTVAVLARVDWPLASCWRAAGRQTYHRRAARHRRGLDLAQMSLSPDGRRAKTCRSSPLARLILPSRPDHQAARRIRPVRRISSGWRRPDLNAVHEHGHGAFRVETFAGALDLITAAALSTS
jgi:hypothetical protein